jgi:sugar phosphate isomerase/epimerase
MPKLGIVHYNFASPSLDEFLKFVSDTGYGYVELQVGDVWGRDVENPEQNAEAVRKQVESYGLQVSALAAGNDFVVLDAETIGAQVERMRRIAGLTKILGTSVIRTEGGSPKDSVPESRWVEAMAGCLKRCLEFAERDDIYLAVDNHGVVTNDADLQVELYEQVGSKHVGANLDTMNYRWFGHDLETVGRYYEIIAPYTLHTHLKDGTGARGDYRGEALGEGEIELAKAIRCLKDVGYDGVWCCEYEGRENDGTGQRKSYQYMKTVLSD